MPVNLTAIDSDVSGELEKEMSQARPQSRDNFVLSDCRAHLCYCREMCISPDESETTKQCTLLHKEEIIGETFRKASAKETLKLFVCDNSPIPEESSPVYLAVTSEREAFRAECDWGGSMIGEEPTFARARKVSATEALKMLDDAQHDAEHQLLEAQKRLEVCRKIRQVLQPS